MRLESTNSFVARDGSPLPLPRVVKELVTARRNLPLISSPDFLTGKLGGTATAPGRGRAVRKTGDILSPLWPTRLRAKGIARLSKAAGISPSAWVLAGPCVSLPRIVNPTLPVGPTSRIPLV